MIFQNSLFSYWYRLSLLLLYLQYINNIRVVPQGICWERKKCYFYNKVGLNLILPLYRIFRFESVYLVSSGCPRLAHWEVPTVQSVFFEALLRLINTEKSHICFVCFARNWFITFICLSFALGNIIQFNHWQKMWREKVCPAVTSAKSTAADERRHAERKTCGDLNARGPSRHGTVLSLTASDMPRTRGFCFSIVG